VIGGATGAASKLGVKRTTLIGMMRRLGVSRPGHPELTDHPSYQSVETKGRYCEE